MFFGNRKARCFKNTQSNFLNQEKKAELAAKELLLESLQGGALRQKDDTTLFIMYIKTTP
jgi:hypothetical protein